MHWELHISIRIEEWRSQKHSTSTLPWIAWRRVVSLTHGMTKGSTQQQICCRMMGREKRAVWNKHVHLQKQTENGWLLSDVMILNHAVGLNVARVGLNPIHRACDLENCWLPVFLYSFLQCRRTSCQTWANSLAETLKRQLQGDLR